MAKHTVNETQGKTENRRLVFQRHTQVSTVFLTTDVGIELKRRMVDVDNAKSAYDGQLETMDGNTDQYVPCKPKTSPGTWNLGTGKRWNERRARTQ